MRMRSCFPLVVLLALNACGGFGSRRAATPAPATDERWVPAGSRVKASVIDGSVVRGTLLMPFRPRTPEIVICESADPCATLTAPGVRTLPVTMVRELYVWQRQYGSFTYFGLYSGAAVGVLLDGEDGDGLLVAAGLAGGAALGYAIGSRVEGWSPLLRCFHACGWSDEHDPAAGRDSVIAANP
jgi:hypothetical protein